MSETKIWIRMDHGNGYLADQDVGGLQIPLWMIQKQLIARGKPQLSDEQIEKHKAHDR